jgi:hypothetical protein
VHSAALWQVVRPLAEVSGVPAGAAVVDADALLGPVTTHDLLDRLLSA